MKKNRLHKIVVVVLLVIVGVITLPWTIIHLSGLMLPTPPAPQNTYGEFPFRIVYEIGDERFEIEDVLICEYLGRNRESFTGRELKWDIRLLSGNQVGDGLMSFLLGSATEWKYGGSSIKLLANVDTGKGFLGGIYIDIGSAQYYLGYFVLDGYNPGMVFNNSIGILDKDTLWEKYKIRIIETFFSEPMIGNGIDMTP